MSEAPQVEAPGMALVEMDDALASWPGASLGNAELGGWQFQYLREVSANQISRPQPLQGMAYMAMQCRWSGSAALGPVTAPGLTRRVGACSSSQRGSRSRHKRRQGSNRWRWG